MHPHLYVFKIGVYCCELKGRKIPPPLRGTKATTARLWSDQIQPRGHHFLHLHFARLFGRPRGRRCAAAAAAAAQNAITIIIVLVVVVAHAHTLRGGGERK